MVTVWCAALSGGWFGAIFEPADNAPNFWATASAVVAAITITTGYATYMLARPARTALRLALTGAATWAALATTVATGSPQNVAVPLIAASQIATLAAILPPTWRDGPKPAPPAEPAHQPPGILATTVGLFAGAVVTLSALAAGTLAVTWAALQTLRH